MQDLPIVAARQAHSIATASVGATEPSRYARRKSSTPAASRYFAGLNVVFETERVRVRSRGKQAIRKLKQAKKAIHV